MVRGVYQKGDYRALLGESAETIREVKRIRGHIRL